MKCTLSFLLTASFSQYVFVFRSARLAERKLTPESPASGNLQPTVIGVEAEQEASSRLLNSVSNASGTPWCQGRPTFWLVGHQGGRKNAPTLERPFCEVEPGTWKKSNTTALDLEDEMNNQEKKPNIDRHSCQAMDINKDGLDDLVCVVGAEKGLGKGWNEVYLTQDDGSLQKVLSPSHGLYKYQYMRTRFTAKLRSRGGRDLLFIGTQGVPREDGNPNEHRMFVNDYQADDISPWFKEVEGPWIKYFNAVCLEVTDLSGKGYDDLIICDDDGLPMIVEQNANLTFTELSLSIPEGERWTAVRVADVTGDGFDDLIVATKKLSSDDVPQLRVYRGIKGRRRIQRGYFKFKKPWFSLDLETEAPGLEVLDMAVFDGKKAIYVVQVGTSKDTYCGTPGNYKLKAFWDTNNVDPPLDWSAPLDTTHDLLLTGTGNADDPFQATIMEHMLPGCGNIAEQFDDTRMILAQGNMGHPGYNYLLEWK